jgi:hypothetical protein
MNDYNYDNILSELRTVDDLDFLNAEIDMLLVSLYKTDPTEYQNILKAKIQQKLAEELTLSMTEQKVALDDRDQLESYLNGLKKFLSFIPVLHLTLAYQPGNDEINQLAEWARTQTGKPVVLHLYHNSSLLGGAVITFEGKYIDLSLKKRLSTVYESKKGEILALLGESRSMNQEASRPYPNTNGAIAHHS